MMPPWAFAAARKEAPIHAQLFALNSAATRREGAIEGCIVRIFRDRDMQVYFGQRLKLRVPVVDRDARGAPELGGPIRLYGEDLMASRWFEAFLQKDGERLDLVRSQIAPIRHPTWRPVCPPDYNGVLFAGNLVP